MGLELRLGAAQRVWRSYSCGIGVPFDGFDDADTNTHQRAGINRDTPDLRPGEIVKDPKTGNPTGLLRNAAQLLKVIAPARQPTPRR